MIDKSRILTAGATLFAAASVGFVMQNGGAIAARLIADRGDVSAGQTELAALAGIPGLPADRSIFGRFDSPTMDGSTRIAAVTEPLIIDVQSDAMPPSRFELGCDVSMSAVVEAGAMVRLSLDAPCHPDERVSISHEGIAFAELTDAYGILSVVLPAMARDATISARFNNGDQAIAHAEIFALDGYERLAINWAGPATMDLHALEFGAGFDDPGHVWAMAPGDPSTGVEAKGGFLTVLGNPDLPNPRLAQVYSAPYGRMNRQGDIDVMVEAAIDDVSCGRSVGLRTIRVTGARDARQLDVALSMPPCGGEDGFLVLKNLFPDLKIAQN